MTVENVVIVRGEFITNPSDNNIGSAKFVRCTATGDAQTVTLKNSSGITQGSLYLHAAGDTIIVEKPVADTITIANGNATSVDAWSVGAKNEDDVE